METSDGYMPPMAQKDRADVFSEQQLQEAYQNPGSVLGYEAMDVGTGDGKIVGRDKAVYTQGLWGCVAVFIEVGNKKALYHLTPTSSRFSFRVTDLSGEGHDKKFVQDMAAEMVTSLKGTPEEMSDAKVCIVANIALETDSNYSYSVLQKEWQFLQQSFKDAGAKNTTVTEVPMDNTMVLHSPADPNHLYVGGLESSINDDGSQKTSKTKITFKKISLDALEDSLLPHPVSFYAHEQKRAAEIPTDVVEKTCYDLIDQRNALESLIQSSQATPEQIELYKKVKITFGVFRNEFRSREK